MTTEVDHPCARREHIEAFATRWKASGAAERANCQLFLAELCDILHTPRPEPTTPHDEANGYVFERSVTFNNGDGTTSPGRIDLYKRGCFVLEAKQGADKGDGVGVLSAAGKANLAKRRKGTATRDTAGWEMAMMMAKGQAENYVRALPAAEGRPPFVVVVDVGLLLKRAFSKLLNDLRGQPHAFKVTVEDLWRIHPYQESPH